MKRVPKQATSKAAAYFELTKPSITFLILISTALGYYLGGDGIDNNIRFLVTLAGSVWFPLEQERLTILQKWIQTG